MPFKYLLALLMVAAVLLVRSDGARPVMAAGQIPVDLELVLAVDTSASVDDQEYDLQMKGLVQAFQDPAVIAAIKTTGARGIAVGLVQWSSANQQRLMVPWTRIRSGAEAFSFAAQIAAIGERQFTGSTGIGSALQFAERSIRRNRFEGARKSIDVSGDGPNNSGIFPSLARGPVIAAGVTINGLAILNEAPVLDLYYRRDVIGGPGAFVMTVKDYDSMVKGMRRKLIREISAAIASNETPRNVN